MSTLVLEILSSDPCQMYVTGTSDKKIKLYVHVWGLFPTSGWINPSLVLRVPRPGTTPPPPDSFAELDFYAEAPPQGSIVFNALTPILREAIVELPWIVHGIRIYGQNNSQERFIRFGTGASDKLISDGNDFVPIPWHLIKDDATIGR